MLFYRDDSAPENSKERYYSHTICEGGPDSLVLKVPAHWHRHHDEYMTCLEGEIELLLDGRTSTAKPGDDEVFIERTRVHGFTFPKGRRTVLQERTSPTGEFKQRFFEDVFGLEGMSFWSMMRGFADGDTFIAMTPFRWLDVVFMAVLGLVARIVKPREGGVMPMSIAPSVPMEGKKRV